MKVSLKKVMAFALALILAAACFSACGADSDETIGSSEDITADISEPESIAAEESVADSSDEGSSISLDDSESDELICVPTKKTDPVMQIPTEFGYDSIDAYFDDSVFIGYSIMMHFGRYVDDWREKIDGSIMGTAEFRAGVGMNFRANKNQNPDSSDTTLPKHNNVAYYFEDLPDAMGVKTMIIGLMPYSDMGLGSTETCALKGAEIEIEGLKRIKFLNPELNIIVLSGTYNTGYSKDDSFKFDRYNNKNIRTFNNYILDYCNSAGIDFIDVSTPLTNGYGLFLTGWASDACYHIKQEPYKIWIQVLRDYARKKQAGTWQNYSVMPELGFEVE